MGAYRENWVQSFAFRNSLCNAMIPMLMTLTDKLDLLWITRSVVWKLHGYGINIDQSNRSMDLLRAEAIAKL